MGASNGIATLDDSVYDRLLRERIVVLGQEVDDEVATKLVAQLLLLAGEDPSADITLYINSPGGSVFAGMAIYDTMHAIEPDVATVATGMAASMGQFLLTAGAPGKRHALPHAQVMMHQPSGGAGGSESDIVIRAEMLGKLKKQIAELTARHAGQPVERIEADFDRDRWFTAQEAAAYGLVDGVMPRA
ncbi:MAG: ATP-dependent Clp protease proteolytic subunit [Actinomycetes bacterium]